jgi:hypothetical protein
VKEEVLQVYFDRLSLLLVDKNLLAIAAKSNSIETEETKAQPQGTTTVEEQELLNAAINVIRARTLSILRRFENDPNRKTSVIRFLIEADIVSKLKLNLFRADLRKIDLSGADLIGANLGQSHLSRAYLLFLDLRGANLRWAHLIGTYLCGADLSNADLHGADLRWANLSEANLSGANLKDIQWNPNTTWPSKEAVAQAKNPPDDLSKELGLEDQVESGGCD